MAKAKKSNKFNQVLITIIVLIAVLIIASYIISKTTRPVTYEGDLPPVIEEQTAAPTGEVIEELPTVTKKVLKTRSVSPTYVDKCGNREKDLGETCSSCPSDVPCAEGYSCIDAECQEVRLRYTGTEYCGHLKGGTNRDLKVDLTSRAVNFGASCEFEGSEASKAFDGKRELSQFSWICINKEGLELPQFVSAELEKVYITNHVRVLQKGGSDLFNVRKVGLSVSIDSTDGKNGHWIQIDLGKDNILYNSQEGFLDLFFNPVSAKWVRVIVLDTWKQPPTHLALGEVDVFESMYICDDDYNSYR